MTAPLPERPGPNDGAESAFGSSSAQSEPAAPTHQAQGLPGTIAGSGPVRRTRPWWAARPDLIGAGTVLAVLAVAGVALGVLWYLVAPRQAFRIDAAGNAVRVGAVESEALVGADGWFVLITAATGLLAGLAAWRWRSVRGPAVVVGLAAGGVLGALAASWIGHLLGPGPSVAALRHAGGPVLHTPLELRSKAGLVVEPFVAVAAYLVATGFAREDDLGRGPRRPPELPASDFLPH